MSTWRRLADGIDNPIVVKEGVSRMRTWRAPVVATLYVSLIGAVGFAWLNLGEASQQFSDRPPGGRRGRLPGVRRDGLLPARPGLPLRTRAGGRRDQRRARAADARRAPGQPGLGLRDRLGKAGRLDGLHPAADPDRAAALLGGLPLRRDRPPAVRLLAGRHDLDRALPRRDRGLLQRALPAQPRRDRDQLRLRVRAHRRHRDPQLHRQHLADLQPGERGQRGQPPGGGRVVLQPLLRALQRALPEPGDAGHPARLPAAALLRRPAGGERQRAGARPWFVCVVFEAILAVAAVAGAVYLVRRRRLFRPRRPLEPAETVEAG